MLERKLIDYLPPVLQNVMEFQAINEAQQPEFDMAWESLNFLMDNQFIDTATEVGVKAWEEELNLVPLATDTLDDRKLRVKTAWASNAVYTYKWLSDWLKIACKENVPHINLNDYTLRITLPVSVDYSYILDSMRKYIPVNIFIDAVILFSASRTPCYAGAVSRFSSVTKLQTDRIDVTKGAVRHDT